MPPLAQTATTPSCSLAPGRGGCRPRWGRLPPLSRLRRVYAWLLGGVDAAPVGGAHHPLVACARKQANISRGSAPCRAVPTGSAPLGQ